MLRANIKTDKGLLSLVLKDVESFYNCSRLHSQELFGNFGSVDQSDFERRVLFSWNWVKEQNLLSRPDNINFLFECVDDIGISILILALYFPQARFWLRNIDSKIYYVLRDGVTNSYSDKLNDISNDRIHYIGQQDPRPKVNNLVVIKPQTVTHEEYIENLSHLMQTEIELQCREQRGDPDVSVVIEKTSGVLHEQHIQQQDYNVKQHSVDNFVMLESIYGKFIVARTCRHRAESLVKTGRTSMEEELMNIFAIIDTLPQGSVIIDGGANIGFVTVPVAQRVRGKDIKVISFEPQRQLFNALSGSLALNGLSHVHLHNCGLSDKEGHAELPELDYSRIFDFGIISVTEDITIQEHKWMNTRIVNTVSIDGMNLPRLDFLKLDIEGHELPALQGGINTFKQHRPWIWVEYAITGAEAIKDSLSTLSNYQFYIVDRQNMICVPEERVTLPLIQQIKSDWFKPV